MPALLVGVLLFLSEAQAQVRVSISAPPAAPGELTLASVSVDQAAGLAGAEILIGLPDFVSAGPAQTVRATADFLIASRPQPGRIEIAMARAEGLAERQTTLLQIPLRIARTASPGVYALAFGKLRCYDAQPSAIPAQALFGSINIVAAPLDSDNDGLPDSWEAKYFGNIAGPPIRDSDQDGLSDYHEFAAGTDPSAADSVFRLVNIQEVSRAGLRTAVIQWQAVEGRRYEVQWSDGLFGPSMIWHKVHNPEIRKDGSILSWTDDGTRTHNPLEIARERYYRIVVVAEPE